MPQMTPTMMAVFRWNAGVASYSHTDDITSVRGVYSKLSCRCVTHCILFDMTLPVYGLPGRPGILQRRQALRSNGETEVRFACGTNR